MAVMVSGRLGRRRPVEKPGAVVAGRAVIPVHRHDAVLIGGTGNVLIPEGAILARFVSFMLALPNQRMR